MGHAIGSAAHDDREVVIPHGDISSLKRSKHRIHDDASPNGVEDLPLEFVGKVARTRAMAEAGHVERRTSARHGY
jgi:hypothetical protein